MAGAWYGGGARFGGGGVGLIKGICVYDAGSGVGETAGASGAAAAGGSWYGVTYTCWRDSSVLLGEDVGVTIIVSLLEVSEGA